MIDNKHKLFRLWFGFGFIAQTSIDFYRVFTDVA